MIFSDSSICSFCESEHGSLDQQSSDFINQLPALIIARVMLSLRVSQHQLFRQQHRSLLHMPLLVIYVARPDKKFALAKKILKNYYIEQL